MCCKVSCNNYIGDHEAQEFKSRYLSLFSRAICFWMQLCGSRTCEAGCFALQKHQGEGSAVIHCRCQEEAQWNEVDVLSECDLWCCESGLLECTTTIHQVTHHPVSVICFKFFSVHLNGYIFYDQKVIMHNFEINESL